MGFDSFEASQRIRNASQIRTSDIIYAGPIDQEHLTSTSPFGYYPVENSHRSRFRTSKRMKPPNEPKMENDSAKCVH